jgi:DNA-binding transcriptional MerR regulator
MDNDGPLLSIGELARRTGLPVRTIRFWSDAGVLPPATRTESGRRLYGPACADRAELVATLRELGLGLAGVRRVLAGQASIAEVAAAHRDALDAQVRVLQLHRAALAAVVQRAACDEEKATMNKLAEMPAAERRQMIDDFLAEVFQGLDPSPARPRRWAEAPDLPDDPSPGQAGAWVELAGLVSDQDFRRQTRQVTEHGIQLQASGLEDLADWATQHAVAALLLRGTRRRSLAGTDPELGQRREQGGEHRRVWDHAGPEVAGHELCQCTFQHLVAWAATVAHLGEVDQGVVQLAGIAVCYGQRPDPGSLHIDHHLLARAEPRTVLLRDRPGRQRLEIKPGEHLPRRAPSSLASSASICSAERASHRSRPGIRSGSGDRAAHAVALDRDLALSLPAFSAKPLLE